VLADEMPQGTEFIGKISRTGHTTRPLGEVLTEILSGLREATGSRATAIFGWNRSTKEVTLEASWGLQRADFDRCRPNLHKSPVADLVYQPELPLLYSNLDEQSHGKFLYLRGILGPALDGGWPLQSCIGLYVCEELDIAYTLFVFGDRIDAFHSDASILSRAAASVAQAAIREHWIVAQVVSERRLTTLGGIVTSATHELRGRLNALEAVNSVDRSWKLLRTHPEKLRDPVFIAKMEERVGGLKKARQSMESVVGRILGWVRTEDDSLLNLRECLGRVLAAAYDVATKHKVEIAHDLGYAPEIRSNAVDLEQAFLNIVLNGVLHMKGTGRQGGRLTIQLKTLDPPKGPIQIRFTDTGPGIHSRLLDPTIWGEERIFNPLFTTKQSGTGMGLYIVRGLLANHGATVRVEKTAIWAGTTFLVEIPLHRAKTEENQR
jgi:signal transduction histidine kinase